MAIICLDCCELVEEPTKRQLCPHCKSRRLIEDEELLELSIVHMDCDSFYASVEKRDRPELRNKPVIIGGDGGRGVVSTACYIARTYGVRSAMPMFKAKKLCPDAIILRGNMKKYAAVSKEIMAKMHDLSPNVEPLSIDEAFIDLSGTYNLHKKHPAQLVAKVAKEIEDEIGVTISIGLSYNKFLAKLASDLNKPRGFSILPQKHIKEILAPLSVRKIWGVGAVFAKKLEEEGIETFKDLQDLGEENLTKQYGASGLKLSKLCLGIDSRNVKASAKKSERKSIGRETTFFEDISDPDQLKKKIWRLSEQVHQDSLRLKMAGFTVTLKVKTNKFQTYTRSTTLNDATMMAQNIYDIACQMLEKLKKGQAYRLIGVSISNLTTADKADPLDLLEPQKEVNQKVEGAMDEIRKKFGQDMIFKGRSYRD